MATVQVGALHGEARKGGTYYSAVAYACSAFALEKVCGSLWPELEPGYSQ